MLSELRWLPVLRKRIMFKLMATAVCVQMLQRVGARVYTWLTTSTLSVADSGRRQFNQRLRGRASYTLYRRHIPASATEKLQLPSVMEHSAVVFVTILYIHCHMDS